MRMPFDVHGYVDIMFPFLFFSFSFSCLFFSVSPTFKVFGIVLPVRSTPINADGLLATAQLVKLFHGLSVSNRTYGRGIHKGQAAGNSYSVAFTQW